MKKLIWWLFAFTALVASFRPALAAADIEGYTKGQELHHALSVCMRKEDALAVAEAAKKGDAEASAAWESAPSCDNMPVIGPKVGKVIYRVDVEKGGKKAVLSVVEILGEGKVIGYFLTTQTINAPADRNN